MCININIHNAYLNRLFEPGVLLHLLSSDFGYKVVGFLILLAIYRFVMFAPLKLGVIYIYSDFIMYTIDDNNFTLELVFFCIFNDLGQNW